MTELNAARFDENLWITFFMSLLERPGLRFGTVSGDGVIHEYFAFEVDDILAAQANPDAMAAYSGRMVVAIDAVLDEAIRRHGPIVCEIREIELLRLPTSFSSAIRGSIVVAGDGENLPIATMHTMAISVH